MELKVTSGKKDVRVLKTLAAVSRLVSLSVALWLKCAVVGKVASPY